MGADPLTAALVVAGGTLIEQREQSRAARRDSKRAQKVERRIQNVRAARERRQAYRNARRATAAAESGAIAAGTTQTSSFVGGQSGIQSQLASNVSFLEQNRQLANQRSLFMQRAEQHRGRAQDMAAIRGFAMQSASLFTPG